jgi:hypothetical protein
MSMRLLALANLAASTTSPVALPEVIAVPAFEQEDPQLLIIDAIIYNSILFKNMSCWSKCQQSANYKSTSI